ncbi:MAG TPA: CbiX/SirB N-terminal domain-containing protein [Oxalicibacterium sp.]|nr:CbiX/SirB N-terminal domain-containing protein [Oxalicibacterium sp.]
MANGKQRAMILFAHGARDPQWAMPFRRLQEIVQGRAPDMAVSLAFLELMSPRLPEAVSALAAEGAQEVTIVPVFLGQGGHVLRDLPALIDEVKNAHPHMRFKIVDAVGEAADVLNAMASYCLDAVR